MYCPPHSRELSRIVLPLVGVLSLFVMPAAAQQQPDTGLSAPMEALVSMAVTFVVGLALITLYRDETEATTGWIRKRPVASFGRGILVSIFVVGLIVVLWLTQIGIVLLFVLVPILVVIAEFGLLAVGYAVSKSWGAALAVAVLLTAVIAVVPVIGWLVGFVLSTAAYGGVYLQWSKGNVEDNPRGY